ncbi:MAG: HAMP domain-containing histidine kinase [Actinobacteria bacterium]|nr:HAMP domain-containing histidine kinase [Actinomycetota bacterium]
MPGGDRQRRRGTGVHLGRGRQRHAVGCGGHDHQVAQRRPRGCLAQLIPGDPLNVFTICRNTFCDTLCAPGHRRRHRRRHRPWLSAHGRALRPITDFTAETEALAGAGDPSRRLPVNADGKVARLARVFNGALDQRGSSAHAQRRLLANASHELRTPLASLRATSGCCSSPAPCRPRGTRSC